MKLNQLLVAGVLALSLLLVYPVAHADEDKTGISHRVAALEEMTLQQQDQMDALSKWVIVDSNKNVIGNVVSFTYRFAWIVVEMDIDGKGVLLWVHVNGWITRNSVLVFISDDCSGDTYAQVPPAMWFREVYSAVGPGEDNSVLLYEPVGEPLDGPWGSKIAGDGHCEPGEFETSAALVEKLTDNLYATFPRAPNPWSLEQR